MATETLDHLFQELRQKLPSDAPVYFFWGATPEELWGLLVEAGKEVGLQPPALLEIGRAINKSGYNILALSWDGRHLHVTGAQAPAVKLVESQAGVG